MRSDFRAMAAARLRWLSPTEGGRQLVPSGPVYAATSSVRWGDRATANDVSIVIRYRSRGAPDVGEEFDADISFLAPELVTDVLRPSSELVVKEGARVVAVGVVLEVARPDE